ncbi:MAG: APH(3') family aminoglycoside O-phosphotransferase [Gemmatimonas sp.]|nr:APH(3') family aminoglycoside O-phosphotransferase [Gemmatimonas sp.]
MREGWQRIGHSRTSRWRMVTGAKELSGPRIPDSLSTAYATWTWTVESGYPPYSVIFRLTSPAGEFRFLKVTEHGFTPTAEEEVRRLRWAKSYITVPEVLETDRDAWCTWFVTSAMKGRSAIDPSFRDNIPGLLSLFAGGLREFHQMPVAECPFQFRISDALRAAKERLARGRINAEKEFHEEHARLTPEKAIEQLLRTRPATEDLVVCHGDYCFPNVFFEHGRIAGYVDLGELGVADRWWDLAVASWSITWNLGVGHEEEFLAAYGVDPDPERIPFYRLLYDVVS